MSKPKVVLFSIFLALATIDPARAQAQATQGEIVVLALDTARAGRASESFVGTDSAIRDVLANLAQFRVVTMAHHVGDADLASFVDAMQRVVNGSANPAQPIRVDGQDFTPEDVSRMAASSIIVAPAVLDVRSARDAAGLYACDVVTSFAFIALARPRPYVRISIDTHGIDRDRAAALKEAVDAIPPRLASVLGRVPYLRSSWGIIEVQGNEVVLELGRDAGVRRGDEFLVTDGEQSRAKGLLMVRQVGAVTSIATIVYSDSPPRVGDRLLDLARLGTDSTVYVHSILVQRGLAPGGAVPLVGLRQAFSRGFYLLRPFVGIEVPFNLVAAGAPGVPINLYAGGEYDILMGRFQLAPRAAIGFGAFTGLAGPSPDLITHVGGSLGVAASYLITWDIKAEIETGWLGWTGLSGYSGYAYEGAFLGGGVTIKY